MCMKSTVSNFHNVHNCLKSLLIKTFGTDKNNKMLAHCNAKFMAHIKKTINKSRQNEPQTHPAK